MNQTLYTAGLIASMLNLSKRAVELKLEGVAPTVTDFPVRVKGKNTRAWEFSTLPPDLQKRLEQVKPEQYRTVEEWAKDFQGRLTAPALPSTPARSGRADFADVVDFVTSHNLNPGVPQDKRVIWTQVCERYKGLLVGEGRNERQVKRSLLDFLLAELPGLVDAENPRKAMGEAFDYKYAIYLADGDLRDRRAGNSGRKAAWVEAGQGIGEVEYPQWFIPAAKFIYMRANRNWNGGSTTEAVLRTISLPALPVGWKRNTISAFQERLGGAVPVCPVSLRELITARKNTGQPLVPERIARQIRASEVEVRAFRHQWNAELDFNSAHGFSRILNGRTIHAGEVIEPDDGTINFCVWVPWEHPSTESSRRYGCLVGRFQLLLMVDACSWYISAFSYVVRPRGTFRQEDVLKLYQTHIEQHERPKVIRHEGGTFNANRVLDCLKLAGITSHRVHSPHAKAAVEGTFNPLWTKLSVLSDGQIGRFRGEMERENDLLMRCQRGSEDPRKHFVDVKTAIECIRQAVAELNQRRLKAEIGEWIPEQIWKNRPELNRQLNPKDLWKFSPYACDWTIKGYSFGGKVQFFEDVSIPFDFSADWVGRYHRAKIRAYFDPFAEGKCVAKAMLAQDFKGEKAGKILGEAIQNNGYAQQARELFGWGDGPDREGLRLKQINAKAMKAVHISMNPDGAVGVSRAEERDGLGQVNRVEMNVPALPSPKAERFSRADELMRQGRLEMKQEESA